MSLAKVQEEIMELIALISQKKKTEATSKIEELLETIHEGLDFAISDQDLVHWGKFLKIVETLQAKLQEDE